MQSESQKNALPRHVPTRRSVTRPGIVSTQTPLTTALLPGARRATAETPLPRSRARRTRLLLQVDAVEVSSRHVQAQLPQVAERARHVVLPVGHELRVRVPAEGEHTPRCGVREQCGLRAVRWEATREGVLPHTLCRVGRVGRVDEGVRKVGEAEDVLRLDRVSRLRRVVSAEDDAESKLDILF